MVTVSISLRTTVTPDAGIVPSPVRVGVRAVEDASPAAMELELELDDDEPPGLPPPPSLDGARLLADEECFPSAPMT